VLVVVLEQNDNFLVNSRYKNNEFVVVFNKNNVLSGDFFSNICSYFKGATVSIYYVPVVNHCLEQI